MDPKEDIRTMISDARRNFHRAVTDILYDAQRLADSLGNAIGEVSPYQALDAWKRQIVKRIEEDDTTWDDAQPTGAADDL